MILPTLLWRLPTRFRWTLHNIIGHPLCEVLSLVGAHRASAIVHDVTIPCEGAS